MVIRRKKIGIILFNNTSWTGGYYYTLNLFRCLQFLPDNKKPHVVLFYEGKDFELPREIKEIGHPYISYLPLNFKINLAFRILNKIIRTLRIKTGMLGSYSSRTADFLFPCLDYSMEGEFSAVKNIHKIYWVPDFQNKYYPKYFTDEQLKSKETSIRQLIAGNVPMVFSSYNAGQDFKKFYPESRNSIKILRFKSILPDIKNITKEQIFAKYNITEPYFISPNQFWNHKNHIIVIEAASELYQRGIAVNVFFTGKEIVLQNPDYIIKLKEKVVQSGLEKTVRFLGFIDRTDQLVLMKNSVAVIQPSLFEGWSTVIEDSKALGARILVSDIPIHREQCSSNALFFDPHHAKELAEKMATQLQNPYHVEKTSYNEEILAFAEEFINLDKSS
jgi:glycosyltransferase involved in cell wall biosynthesis